MKILNICMNAPFTEGYSYQDNLLSEYQHKLGHSVTVLTGIVTRDTTGKKILTKPCEKVMNNGVQLIRIKTGNKLTGIIGFYPQITQIINKIHPDLIFIHGLCSLTPIQAIKYKKKYPQTILVADNHQDKNIFKYNKLPFSLLLKVWRWGWKRWIKQFNHIYGTTSWRKDFAVEYYGIPRDKADVLLLGVDTDNLPSNIDKIRTKIRHDLNIIEDAFVFIHGGKMDQGKRTIDVIKSFINLKDSNARLVLFGSIGDNIKFQFEQLIAGDPRILYINYIESKLVHQYFYASDFALFPGQHSVLWEESVGCGLPGLFRSYCEEDHINICGNSISVKPDLGIKELSSIMTRVCEDKDYYSILKQNSQKASHYLSYYDIALKSLRF